jgi:acetyl-CoA carboxylase biotin carboxyl carrier protein
MSGREDPACEQIVNSGQTGRSAPEEYPVDERNRRTGGVPQLSDVEAHITGTVWKIEVEVGDSVEEGDTVVVIESMKMEMPVEAEDPGVVKEIRCLEGQSVSEGDTLVVLE